jgi:hypothetical protein
MNNLFFDQGRAAQKVGNTLADNPYTRDGNIWAARQWATGFAQQATDALMASERVVPRYVVPDLPYPQFCVIAPLIHGDRRWFGFASDAAEHGTKLLQRPDNKASSLVLVEAKHIIERARPAPPPVTVRDVKPGDLTPHGVG